MTVIYDFEVYNLGGLRIGIPSAFVNREAHSIAKGWITRQRCR